MVQAQDERALEQAAADIRSALGGAIEVLWDESGPATAEVHRLTVVASEVPLVFPVEHDVLVERGAPYRSFLDDVVAEVSKQLRGTRPAPPTS